MPVRPTKMLPPVWFLLSLAAMGVLHHFAPVARTIPSPWNWLGLIPIIGGVALALSGAGLFRRHGTGVVPFSPATHLVTTGPYRFTRNPMYVGMFLALFGVAAILGTFSPLAVIPPFVWWIRRRFVLEEEAMLHERFGAEYAAFTKRVRRWV